MREPVHISEVLPAVVGRYLPNPFDLFSGRAAAEPLVLVRADQDSDVASPLRHHDRLPLVCDLNHQVSELGAER